MMTRSEWLFWSDKKTSFTIFISKKNQSYKFTGSEGVAMVSTFSTILFQKRIRNKFIMSLYIIFRIEMKSYDSSTLFNFEESFDVSVFLIDWTLTTQHIARYLVIRKFWNLYWGYNLKNMLNSKKIFRIIINVSSTYLFVYNN